MSTSTKITMAQYDEMIRQGRFETREERHVELLYGEIIPMSPINAPHSFLVTQLIRWSIETLSAEQAHVVAQGPVGIPALESEPEPDLIWAKSGDYSTEHPRPADVHVIIEVSDSSLAKDRGLKARLYAEAGIREYWIVNVKARCVEVRRDPQGHTFQSVEVFRPGQDICPLAFPEIAFPVSRIFPS